MPIFAALFKAALASVYGLVLALKSQELAMRLAAALAVAAGYVAAVVLFSTGIKPLIGALFATSYGQVLGLAFPPIAGTVLAALAALWLALVVKNYYHKVIRVAIG